jgi:hypothetical protein
MAIPSNSFGSKENDCIRKHRAAQRRPFLYIGPVIQGPEVTVHLADVTVRDALNAISIATESAPGDEDYPVGWIYRSAAESNADRPRFGGILTLPPDWRETLHPKTPKKGGNNPSPGR